MRKKKRHSICRGQVLYANGIQTSKMVKWRSFILQWYQKINKNIRSGFFKAYGKILIQFFIL